MDTGEAVMKKTIVLTENLLEQLKDVGWLSVRQFEEYKEHYLNYNYTYDQMEMLCKDYSLLDSLFEDKIEDSNISKVTFNIAKLDYGEYCGTEGSFTNLNEAIKAHYKLDKNVGSLSYIIQVKYEVKT